MKCPDHPKDLIADPQGRPSCPFCRGTLLTEPDLLHISEDLPRQLAVETREDSVAFVKVRPCPSCNSPMTPFRLGIMEAWLERCPSCEHFWADKQDLNTLAMLAKKRRVAAAYDTFTPDEKKELARDLAAAAAPPAGVDLSPFQMLLALVGVPVITRTTGNRLPYATWTLSALLVLLFLLGRLEPQELGPEALGYIAGAGVDFGLITASFAHFSWLHLFGNVAFLLAFGDGVEQRWPRWVLPLMFVLGGAATLYIEGEVSGGGALIAGASGGVAIVMGACVVLQRQARVVFMLFKSALIFRVPIIGYCVFAVLYQLAMALIGVPGVAWWAHLSGILLGVMLGIGTRNVDVQREPVAELQLRP